LTNSTKCIIIYSNENEKEVESMAELKNLEALRKVNGYSVEELMTKLGRNENDANNRNAYYYWLKTGQIKVADIIKLHDLFGVSADCILDLAPLTITG
jgi:hypothetical protein